MTFNKLQLRLRSWLIRKLAGKSMVLVNCSISITKLPEAMFKLQNNDIILGHNNEFWSNGSDGNNLIIRVKR